MQKICSHLSEISHDLPTEIKGCEECLKTGDQWIHLRQCMICGHVGCCDDSKNKHATQHFHDTGHPLMKSLERGEDWMWCFVDNVVI